MSQNQPPKLLDLILFSLVLSEREKQILVAHWSQLSGTQREDLTRTLAAEAAERDALLTARLQNDAPAATRYAETLARLSRQTFARAETLSAADADAPLTAIQKL